ncbi:AAA family ATPase [Sodalis sp. RH20]|uniref:AAA family ATPase n=1 Tax=unclassified Sodalis (in: enterobacteria) TaxID=2636512 RepID=UPI0039B6D454
MSFLRNFKCFELLELQLEERLNVIIGDNATGKTRIPFAIAFAMGTFLSASEKSPAPWQYVRCDSRKTGTSGRGTRCMTNCRLTWRPAIPGKNMLSLGLRIIEKNRIYG